jgi:hypothetical protein
MRTGETPEEATPAERRPAPPPRSTPELIAELQERATADTLAAIAVVNSDVTQFVFGIDDEPLTKLNALVGAGGRPIGVVGARFGSGNVEYYSQPFVEYRHNPNALAYLQTLRVPFLTRVRTHLDRRPDSPRNN